MNSRPVATVAGEGIPLAEVDRRERALRGSGLVGVLPAAGTSEGRQLRRWLTQLLVTERVVAVEAAARGIDQPAVATGADTAVTAATQEELLPDATARLELGSVTSAVLDSSALARALFAAVTADVQVTDDEVAGYHARNPYRFARPQPASAPSTAGGAPLAGWDTPPSQPPPLDEVSGAIAADLRAAARRRAFATWLDGRRAELVRLAPGYEHPGDPRQPDNTHKH